MPRGIGGLNSDKTYVELRGRLATTDPERKAHARAEFEAYKRRLRIRELQEELAELVAAGGEVS